MSRIKRYGLLALALSIAATLVVVGVSLADPTVSGSGISGTVPFTFKSSASSSNSPVAVLDGLDGLTVSADCTVASGKPELIVQATSSVSHTDIVANYSSAGQTSAYTTPIGLDSTPRSLFSPFEAGTDGTQLGGVFTYTTPSGENVTATYQWWAGGTVQGLDNQDCVFSGIAHVAGS